VPCLKSVAGKVGSGKCAWKDCIECLFSFRGTGILCCPTLTG